MRVAVVGAGPAGLSFAAGLGDVDIFEEHEKVGLPRHCTSLVSAKSAEGLVPKSVVLNKYDSLTITNLERWIHFKVRGGVYLLDRPGLEEKLAESVNINFGKKIREVRGGYLYSLDGARWGPYDYIAIAEGASRKLSGRFGHVVRLPGLQVDVKSDVDMESINVIYNSKFSRTYFSWVVELDRGLYRVGLVDVDGVVDKLNKLVKYIRGKPVGKPFGGGVLAGPPLKRLIHGRVLLLGDAAGLVKPLSGGGIVLSMRSGVAAAEAVKRGDPAHYERSTWLARLKLRLAFAAFGVLYGQRLVDKLLEALDGGEYVAIDYDDHLLTLASAALLDVRAVRAGVEFLKYLTANRNVFHLF